VEVIMRDSLFSASVDLPGHGWQDTDPERPHGRLYSAIELGGLGLHLTGFWVIDASERPESDDDAEGYGAPVYGSQCPRYAAHQEEFERLCASFDPTGPYCTLSIDGREYAVFADPFAN
jgi:hypothetical protein